MVYCLYLSPSSSFSSHARRLRSFSFYFVDSQVQSQNHYKIPFQFGPVSPCCNSVASIDYYREVINARSYQFPGQSCCDGCQRKPASSWSSSIPLRFLPHSWYSCSSHPRTSWQHHPWSASNMSVFMNQSWPSWIWLGIAWPTAVSRWSWSWIWTSFLVFFIFIRN